MVGYSSPRDLSQAVFVFTAAAGANLQTGQVTVPLSAVFSAWYQSAASAPYGSQFTLTQPFTVTGNQQAVTSLTVTLTNSMGTSAGADGGGAVGGRGRSAGRLMLAGFRYGRSQCSVHEIGGQTPKA